MYNSIIVVPCAIAYVTRRMAIGGWLFVYYLSLFFSFLFFIQVSIIRKEPTSLNYVDSLILAVEYLVFVALFLFSGRLIFKSQRNRENVKILKCVLLASVTINAINVAIYYDFPSGYNLVFYLVWTAYFFSSRRVDCVLANGDGKWDYESFKQRNVKKDEKQK